MLLFLTVVLIISICCCAVMVYMNMFDNITL